MTNIETTKFRVRLSGGLGNQLFQLAAGHFFASQFGARYSLDSNNLHIENSHQNSDLSQIESINRECLEDLKSDRFVLTNRLLRKLIRSNNQFATRSNVITDRNWQEIYENLQSLDSNLLQMSRRTWDLYGYFQDPQLITEDLLNGLRVLINTSLEFKKESHALSTHEFNALHIRGGDYLTSKIHANLQRDYYINAMEHFTQHELPLIVFTNDSLHAVQILGTNVKYKIQDSSGMSAIEVMHLMAMSRNLVISNSTFSYWAARLKSTPGPVFAPRNWYTTNSIHRIQYEHHWIAI